MTESDVVSYIVNQDKKLKETYTVYQKLLSLIKKQMKQLWYFRIYH